MRRYLPPLRAKSFSHIYVESEALSHPRTQAILEKFKTSIVVEISHYKDYFNAPAQDYRTQKESMNLILAIKQPPYFYEGSYYSDAFEFEHFFYTTSMLNCLYDCDYCYLQGLYPSGHLVLFVNVEDFFQAVVPLLHKPTLIAISYDTDTLAIESIAGHTNAWIEFAKTHPNLFLEIRTKSANFKAIAHQSPNPNITLAWTLSPQSIIERYEHKTPSLEQRLRAIQSALVHGWRVRLSIDPMLDTPEFATQYPTFLETIFTTIDPSAIAELTLGVFRMSTAHLKKIKKMEHTSLAFYPYTLEHATATYAKSKEQAMLSAMLTKAQTYLPREKIRTWEQ